MATAFLKAWKAWSRNGSIARYEPGQRSGAWLKMRVNQGQELVIGGYTPTDKNFDALVIGYYEGPKLIYAARTRNGFTPALRAKLFEKMRPLEVCGLPVRQFAGSEERPLGPRSYCRQDERLPLA